MDKDEYIPEYKKLVDMVHKNGANFFMQLVHIGINTFIPVETVYAPSSLPLPNQKDKISKEMTKEEIPIPQKRFDNEDTFVITREVVLIEGIEKEDKEK